jgi:toxin-antitoxin system PIN domain toxin
MISIDTNVLLYGLNRDCPEHPASRAFIETCAGRADVAIAELVLVELYVLLRNPAVVRRPLGAGAAAGLCQGFRRHPRWAVVDSADVMDRVWVAAGRAGAARRHIFDARLAHTLLDHGVTEIATRNTRDFEGFGFARVFDPVGGAF